MNSNSFLINLFRFVSLVLLQVLVFNSLNLFGYINPFIYILFVYWFPVKENRATFLALCFLLGFCVDIFSDTLAINAAATVTIAYFRPLIMRFVFGVNYEFQSFKLNSSTGVQQFTFFTLLTLIHHFTYFLLEIFSVSNTLLILQKSFTVGVGTIVLGQLFISLFSTSRE